MEDKSKLYGQIGDVCVFSCIKSGENGEAHCKSEPMKINESLSIDGKQDLSNIIKFNDNGCVYEIRLITDPTFSLWGNKYEIEVQGQGPKGFFNGSGYLRFFDVTGDHYDLKITNSSNRIHVVDFKSEDPRITRVKWSNKSF